MYIKIKLKFGKKNINQPKYLMNNTSNYLFFIRNDSNTSTTL